MSLTGASINLEDILNQSDSDSETASSTAQNIKDIMEQYKSYKLVERRFTNLRDTRMEMLISIRDRVNKEINKLKK